jgi:mRNA interferase MazF
MEISRGDLVACVLPGDYGKPRPALVIQSDLFREHSSVTVLPITSFLRSAEIFRVLLKPNEETGLRKASQVMVDKAVTLPREKIGKRIGAVEVDTMLAVNRALAVFLGFA